MSTGFTLTRERIADKALEKCGVLGADQVPSSADRALALEAMDLILKQLPLYGYSWPKTRAITTEIAFNRERADYDFPTDYHGNFIGRIVGESGGTRNLRLFYQPEWLRLQRFVGADKVTNGQFTNGITGFTDLSVGDGSISANVSPLSGVGALDLNQGTIGANFGIAEQQIGSLTGDTLHELKLEVSVNNVTVRVGSATGLSDILADTVLNTGDPVAVPLQNRVQFFVPVGANIFIQLESAGAVSTTSTVDNLTLFEFRHGEPDKGYIDAQVDRIFLHPIPNRDGLIRVSYAAVIDDTVAGQQPDVTVPWILGLAYGIAAEIGDEFGVADNKLTRFEGKWAEARGRGIIFDIDQGTIQVQVDDSDPPIATTPTGETPFNR